MNIRSVLAGFALLALLGGCATYDDGYARGYYGDGRYYGHRDRYPYYDSEHRYYWDRSY